MIALARADNRIMPTLWDELLPLPQLALIPETRCQYGDIWQLGRHRVLCGDSTNPADVQRLLGDTKAVLCHADPPYGMGKEKDGVANDNLYGKKLDAFQMQWWKACRPYLMDNASAYIWGNAEDLWRFWYRRLADSERLTFRTEIVWAKGSAGAGGISHMGAEGLRLYPQETERCLFFMTGEQEMSTNADEYWEGWTPIVHYLDQQRRHMNWSIKDTKRIAGHSENSGCHWFDKSQWTMPTRETYDAWREAAHGRAFERDFDTLKRDFLSLRAYFDNTHDKMTDVWYCPRVTGEHRYGHPTPKPLRLIQRMLLSSSPPDSLVYDPFLGSGTTVICAEQTGRICYGIEIYPRHVDSILQRWKDTTGHEAVK